MPADTLPLPQGLPRFGRIADGMRRSGLSRAALYNLAGDHPGLFLKCGHATILNLEMLDEIMAALPPAVITPRKREEVA
jgi:hypothetical protein